MIFLRHSYCRDATPVASPCIILNASQCLMNCLFLLFYETPRGDVSMHNIECVSVFDDLFVFIVL